jgi:co-chaperonin GroES (HSP10)
MTKQPEDKIKGLPQLELYKGSEIPSDYEITELLGDIIQVEFLDLSEDGQSVLRNGIYLPLNVIEQKAWRIGKVLLAGPGVKQVEVGDVVMFPGDKGLPAITKSGKRTIFLNEERIFGICEKKDK